jgi:BirA family biotin operon repressor/biotin-[acetyl-CoA-carboxylase] ligase
MKGMNEIHLESVGSTSTYAKEHASIFPKNQITCIVADKQTGGRGRFQKTWVSPPGNIYATFYFRLPSTQLHLPSLGLVLASSMATMLIAEGLFPQIKWPNDLQLGGKKFCGILCETSMDGTQLDVFLGIGVNINMEPTDLHSIGGPATSLKVETGRTWDQKQILRHLQMQFEKDLELFRHKGFAPFHQLCEDNLAYKGEQVRCFNGSTEWIGICQSLSADGRLNLKLSDGQIHTLASGEISLRKI